jgi:hypothetical protein
MREDEEFAKQVNLVSESMKEFLLDRVEEKLIDAILDDEKGLTKNQTELVKLYLKTQGRSRGYTERTEVKHENDSGAVQINYVVPNPPQIENIEDQNIDDEQNHN